MANTGRSIEIMNTLVGINIGKAGLFITRMVNRILNSLDNRIPVFAIDRYMKAIRNNIKDISDEQHEMLPEQHHLIRALHYKAMRQNHRKQLQF